MRIGGYGAGFGQGESQGDRAAGFRARHSIGQRIKGRILRREAGGLFWVQIGQDELLARLEVQAEPGDVLHFLVRALTPEILLQALASGNAAVDLPGLVQRFRAAREVFELRHGALYRHLAALPPQAALRADAFTTALAPHPEALGQLDQVQALMAQVNAALPGQGLEAVYAPWRLPACRRTEGVRRSLSQGFELLLSGADLSCGAFEARLHSAPEPRLSLAVERAEGSATLQVELAALAREALSAEAPLFGPTRATAAQLQGVLNQLFDASQPWSAGGLNTRV